MGSAPGASTSCGVASHSSWKPALQPSHEILLLESCLPGGQPSLHWGGGGPEKWLSLATTHCLLATLLRKGHTLSWFLPSLLWRQGHLLSSGESPNSWGHLSFNPKRQHKVERGHYEFPWGLADMWLGIKDQSPFLKTTSVSLSGSKGSPL